MSKNVAFIVLVVVAAVAGAVLLVFLRKTKAAAGPPPGSAITPRSEEAALRSLQSFTIGDTDPSNIDPGARFDPAEARFVCDQINGTWVAMRATEDGEAYCVRILPASGSGEVLHTGVTTSEDHPMVLSEAGLEA